MGSDVFRRRGMRDVPGVEGGDGHVDPDGTVRCALSFPSQGQGHATTIAQVVADRLGVALERVRARCPPTPRWRRRAAARSAAAAPSSIGGSVAVAAERVRARLAALAGAPARGRRRRHRARGRPRARARVPRARGRPSRSWRAWRTRRRGAACPPSIGPGLSARPCYFDPPGPTFSGAVHVAAVEVDRETGRVRVQRYVVVEDCGPVVNPTIVEGQIHGAVAQGLGEALLESIVYDAEGQLLTAHAHGLRAAEGRRRLPPSRSATWRPPRPSCRAASRAWARAAPSGRRPPSPTPSPTPSGPSASG